MAQPAFEVKGIREFAAQLRKLDDSAWVKALVNLHKSLAKMAADGARGIAIGMGGVQGKAAGQIKGTGSATGAKVGVGGGGLGAAAFWGMKSHSGWYADPRYDESTGRQHDPWVGNSWAAATFDGGPYAINRALYFDLDQIMSGYERMLRDVTAPAFPN